MDNENNKKNNGLIMNDDFDTAMDWAARLALGELSVPDRQALSAWLNSRPDRQALMDEAATAWSAPSVELAANIAAQTIERQDRSSPREPSSRGLSAWWNRALPIASIAGGAAVAAALALAFYVPSLSGTDTSTEQLVVEAPQSEDVQEQLADGSLMHLARSSRATFSQNQTERRVTLAAGEAVFDVATDPQRPFIVAAGDAKIRVVGTSFNVSRWDQGVRVTVFEGKVEFGDENGTNSVDLLGGQGALLLAGDTLTTFAFNPDEYVDWRSGWVDATDMTLSEIIAKLDRYSDTTILLKNPDLGQSLVSGRFKLSQSSATLETLALLYELNIEHQSGRVVLSQD